MIGKLSGDVLSVGERHLILGVGGVGYKIAATPDTMRKAAKAGTVSLFTHLAVRENALDLYGFLDADELKLFEMLIEVSGIGPRTALQVLSLATVETLRKAIASEDVSYLTKVSGIGQKTAKKIVLELKEKMGTAHPESAGELRDESDAVEALKSLGYSRDEARDALKKAGSAGTTSARVKEALKILGAAR